MSQEAEELIVNNEASSEMEENEQEPIEYSESIRNEYPEIVLMPPPDVDTIDNNLPRPKKYEGQAEFKKLDREYIPQSDEKAEAYNSPPSLPDAQLEVNPKRDEAKNAGANDAFGRVIVSLNNMDLDQKQIPISAYHALFPALGLPLRDKAPSKRKKHDRSARSGKLEAPRRETMGITIENDSIGLNGEFRLKENAGRLLNALLGEYDIKNLTVTDTRDGIHAKGSKQWIFDISQDRSRRYIVRNISFAGSMYYDQIEMFLGSCKEVMSVVVEDVMTFITVQKAAKEAIFTIKTVPDLSDIANLVNFFKEVPNIVSGYTVVLLVKNGAKKFDDAIPPSFPSQPSSWKYNCILSKTRWLKVTEEFKNPRCCIVQVFDREETPYPSKSIDWIFSYLSSSPPSSLIIVLSTSNFMSLFLFIP